VLQEHAVAQRSKLRDSPGESTSRFDWNSNPISLPGNETTDTAYADLAEERTDLGATPVPIPGKQAGRFPPARKSTSAGMPGSKNWNVSITGTFFTCRTARWLLILKSTAVCR
jgi:hypothetical protein